MSATEEEAFQCKYCTGFFLGKRSFIQHKKDSHWDVMPKRSRVKPVKLDISVRMAPTVTPPTVSNTPVERRSTPPPPETPTVLNVPVKRRSTPPPLVTPPTVSYAPVKRRSTPPPPETPPTVWNVPVKRSPTPPPPETIPTVWNVPVKRSPTPPPPETIPTVWNVPVKRCPTPPPPETPTVSNVPVKRSPTPPPPEKIPTVSNVPVKRSPTSPPPETPTVLNVPVKKSTTPPLPQPQSPQVASKPIPLMSVPIDTPPFVPDRKPKLPLALKQRGAARHPHDYPRFFYRQGAESRHHRFPRHSRPRRGHPSPVLIRRPSPDKSTQKIFRGGYRRAGRR